MKRFDYDRARNSSIAAAGLKAVPRHSRTSMLRPPLRWSAGRTASPLQWIFYKVFFDHKKTRLRLKHRREELIRETPLPVSETDEEDANLVNHMQKPTPQ